jgi:hypothetical protein
MLRLDPSLCWVVPYGTSPIELIGTRKYDGVLFSSSSLCPKERLSHIVLLLRVAG